jgi:N-acyl homoserine lactone hydrolase
LPDDIKYVINTHLHWDHAGGNRFFPRAVFLVQRAEYRYALYPDQFYASLYVQSLFAPDSEAELHYELLEGDREIVKGVSVVMTPGHTPGHQAVVVNLPRSGTIIFAGDAILTWENMEKDLPQGLCRHQALYLESLHRLVHLAGEGGLIVPGHDPALTQRVRVSPEYYD